jgi:hypothetical protein
MKINVQKLRGMGFPQENVPPYGDCIIVPGDKFDPDWEFQLEDQGYPIVMTDRGGKAVTLVRLMGQDVEEVTKSTPSTSATESTSTDGVRPTSSMLTTVKPTKRIPAWLLAHPEKIWKDVENGKLARLWNQDKPRLTVAAIAKEFVKEFPNRTSFAVNNQLSRMKKSGLIKLRKPRKHPKHPEKKPRHAKEKLPDVQAPGPAVEASTPVQSEKKRVLSIEQLGNEVTKMKEDIDRIRDILRLQLDIENLQDKIQDKTVDYVFDSLDTLGDAVARLRLENLKRQEDIMEMKILVVRMMRERRKREFADAKEDHSHA